MSNLNHTARAIGISNNTDVDTSSSSNSSNITNEKVNELFPLSIMSAPMSKY